MLIIHDEPVEVLREGDRPVQFLLRERLYLVRAVLAHWLEPAGWRWSGPSRPSPPGVPKLPQRMPSASQASRPIPVGRAGRELWRVQAAAGRTASPAVFDLCCARALPRWTATTVEE
jgi:Family of unknown function (DUF6504)